MNQAALEVEGNVQGELDRLLAIVCNDPCNGIRKRLAPYRVEDQYPQPRAAIVEVGAAQDTLIAEANQEAMPVADLICDLMRAHDNWAVVELMRRELCQFTGKKLSISVLVENRQTLLPPPSRDRLEWFVGDGLGSRLVPHPWGTAWPTFPLQDR